MSAIERFANAAEAFQRWALDGVAADHRAARAALTHLAELFGAALALPAIDSEASNAPRVSDEQWQRVFQACSALPVQHYGEVFDPLTLTTGGLDVGDVADDIADIYRDIVTGLRVYQNGDHAEAVWQWRFTFWSHWGRHAVGAMSALRAWLEDKSAW